MIDCDPGIDDALAVLLALGSPGKIDVRAVISIFGNVPLRQTKNNLLKALSFCGDRGRRVLLGAGSASPMKGAAPAARHIHGDDGMADLAGLSSHRSKKSIFKCGIDLIIKLALSKKIDSIIATGPLTDLAMAIKKDSSFIRYLDEIVIMGGAVFEAGNVTPYAEFNFYCDPEAARIALNSGARKRLVSLDVTHKTLLTGGYLRPFKSIDTPASMFIRGMAEYSIRSNKKRGLTGAPMHDPLAVGLVIDSGLGEYEDLCLDVVTKGKERGRVVVKDGKPNVRFCRKVDAKGFFDLLIEALLKTAKTVRKERV